MTVYSDILDSDVNESWKTEWNELRPEEKTENFSWKSLHLGAVYRVTLCHKKDFEIAVCNSGQNIVGTIPENTIISVGKTKDFAERMKVHFTPSSKNSNRLLTRLKNIFKEADGLKWLSKMISAEEIKIEYIKIDDWWKRDLLESYGKAIHSCLFDLEIEH